MKGKILYNRFIRAAVEVIFVILVIIDIAIVAVGNEVFTSDMIDGSGDFYDSKVVKEAINSYESNVFYYIVNYANDYYIENKKDSQSFQSSKEETVSSEYDEDNYPEVEAYYLSTHYNETMSLEGDFNLTDIIKKEDVLNRIKKSMDRMCVNYSFRIRYGDRDEVIYSYHDNEDSYEFINSCIIRMVNNGEYADDGEYLFIDNYVSKHIVEGDDFYKCKKWYNFFNDNIRNIVIICVIAGFLTIILGIYIVLMAGYNENGELGTSWLDNIPIELYFFSTILIIFLTTEMLNSMYYTSIESIIFSIVSMIIVVMMMVTDLKTVISRLKNKVFIKKSLLGKLALIFKNIIKNTFADFDKKWKAAILIALVFLSEAIIILGFITSYTMAGLGILLWIFMKAGQFILLMYLYNDICDIRKGAKDMHDGISDVKINTDKMSGVFRQTAEYMNDVSAGLDKAVAEKLKSEQLKTELITNVSHDIKTPLTSIINYIDLMKKEDIDNDTLREYLEVVDKQSIRLKKLTEDVIEASKAATGNINVEQNSINVSEMLSQSLGEYENKFTQKNLQVIYNEPERSEYVMADGRLLWRVIDNLFSNIYKYSLEGTRVYIDIIDENSEYVNIIFKNVSKNQLNISSDELMQRFVRGDTSRTTDGNGLGLSISESLTTLQGGVLEININGDLFTSILSLKKSENEEKK